MGILSSSLDKNSAQFAENRSWMLEKIQTLRMYEERVRRNSSREEAKFHKRGQLLPRERLAQLLDTGEPFLELSTLAGLKMHDDDGDTNASGGGCIAGIGTVSGVRAVVVVTDSGIKGGAVSPMGLRKALRMQQIALENRLPLITLAESAGANLQYQSELFIEGGRTFANQARLSAAGILQITVVHGSSTAGGAYLPGLSDYVVLVRGKSKIFLAGPPLLKAATGEIATDEALGGASMHAEIAGTGEYLAEDDAHAIQIARDLLAKLPWNDDVSVFAQQQWQTQRRLQCKEPRYAVDDLLGIVPANSKKPYDVRELIARVVDDSDFLEFKENYGSHTICGHAAIGGMRIGILGNNGPIDVQGATKAAQFIQLCTQSDVPLLFLMNTTGYLVGTDAERGGIVKHGSKMIQAVANAPVEKITLVVGGSWGAGNYGMCGRGFDPRFILSWPTAKVGVMGPEQAATVMDILAAEKFRKMGVDVENEEFAHVKQDLQKARDELIARMEPETEALFATARLWDDGIIDPRDTRRVLRLLLSTCYEARARKLHPIPFGVPRF